MKRLGIVLLLVFGGSLLSIGRCGYCQYSDTTPMGAHSSSRRASAIATSSSGLAGAASAQEELKPIPAAEAERRVTESRDSLTDMLWIGLDVYWHVGKWEDCLRICHDIIVIDPQFVEAYTSAAWMLWSSGRDQEAIAYYEKGIKENPDNPDLYFEYGFYYRNRGKLGKAIELLRKAAEKGATRGQQHLLPNTLYEAGRKQEALDEWRAVLKRFPKDPVAPRKIAELEKELAAEQEQKESKGETH